MGIEELFTRPDDRTTMLSREELAAKHVGRDRLGEIERVPISVVLHRPTHPNNCGSAARLADAIRAEHLFICGTRPGWNVKSRKPEREEWGVTDKSAHKWQPHSFVDDTVSLLQTQKEAGYHIIALERTKTSVPYNAYPYKLPISVVVGTEEGGLPDEVLALCDGVVEIPMRGAVRYLNLATALAVVLYKITEAATE